MDVIVSGSLDMVIQLAVAYFEIQNPPLLIFCFAVIMHDGGLWFGRTLAFDWRCVYVPVGRGELEM